jgi:hypothetical protein
MLKNKTENWYKKLISAVKYFLNYIFLIYII